MHPGEDWAVPWPYPVQPPSRGRRRCSILPWKPHSHLTCVFFFCWMLRTHHPLRLHKASQNVSLSQTSQLPGGASHRTTFLPLFFLSPFTFSRLRLNSLNWDLRHSSFHRNFLSSLSCFYEKGHVMRASPLAIWRCLALCRTWSGPRGLPGLSVGSWSH